MNIFRKCPQALIFLLFLCAPAYSQSIYKWVDSKGNTHYTTVYQKIPPQYRNYIAEPEPKRQHQSIRFKKKSALGSGFETFRNESHGFRDIKWNTAISELKNMEYYASSPIYSEIKFYERKGDSLRMGPAELDRILYIFWKGRFRGVLITTQGSHHWETLRRACYEEFGKATKPNRDVEQYVWDGHTSRICLRYSRILNRGILHIYSTTRNNRTQENQWVRGRKMVNQWVAFNLVP